MPKQTSVQSRLRWGTRYGLYYGLVASGLALLKAALGGALPIRLPVVLVLYLVGGTLTGAIVGLLKPWASTGLRAAAVGFIAMVPFSFVTSLFVATPAQLRAYSPWAQLVLAAMYGGVLGPYFRWRVHFGRDD